MEDDAAAQVMHQSAVIVSGLVAFIAKSKHFRRADRRHIYGKNLIHWDLTPENVLWISNGFSEFMDFGSAKAQELDTRTHPSGDVPEHIAAEVWLSDGQDLGDDRRPASFL